MYDDFHTQDSLFLPEFFQKKIFQPGLNYLLLIRGHSHVGNSMAVNLFL